jgi:NAD(P)-dependent dehydrogenase (short-subunit alcohol dehydrogenase family)
MSVFAGKSIIVTGASEGIGRALCLALAPQRPRLALAARNCERLESIAAECHARGAEVRVQPTDVTDPAACRALVNDTARAFGGIDVLVNNAGGTMWARFDRIEDVSIFESLMRVNYLGSVYPTLHALPHLKASRGRIVAVSSVAGLTGVPERTAYAASKHAITGLFDSLRIELAGTGVSVTLIHPDFVVSEIHRRALGPDGRPLGESPMAGSRIMTAERCAALMVRAMERRDRALLTSARGRLGRWLKLVAPGAIDRIAAKAIRDRR